MYTTYFLCNIFNALKHFCFACLTKWNSENLSVQRSPGPFCRESQWEIFSACPPSPPSLRSVSLIWNSGEFFQKCKRFQTFKARVTCIVRKEGRRVKPSSAFQQKVFQFLSAHQPCKLCAWNQPHLYRAKDVWQNIIWKQFLKSAFTPLRVSNLTANMSTFPKGSKGQQSM